MYIQSSIQRLGSYARGDYTNESDVNGLIVFDVFPHYPREGFVIAYGTRFPKVKPVAMNALLKVSDRFLKILD